MDAFTDAIIESVRENSCIYDKGHRDYKDLLKKEKAWAEVSVASGRSKEECKRKWLYLREKFSKEEKKRALPTGSKANLDETEWPYFDSMVFLRKFIQPRQSRKNIFELPNEYCETKTDNTSSQQCSAKKKKKIDKFDEACEAVQKATEQITSDRSGEPTTRRKINQNFLETICDLMEVLPEEQQDSAMVQILTYITDIRKYCLQK